MIEIIGLPNCDSCKKAKRWLDEQSLDYKFRHIRDEPPTEQELARWLKAVGWETLLNRRSTTWRELDESEKSDLTTEKVKGLLARQPTLIKRPVALQSSHTVVGFKPDSYQSSFLK